VAINIVPNTIVGRVTAFPDGAAPATPAPPDRPPLDITPAPPGYHSEAQFDAALDHAVAAGGARVVRRRAGHSVHGRPIDALTIAAPGRTPSPDRPHAVIQGGMHGVEVIGTELALALLDLLVDASTPEASALLDECDVTVVPCLNPDSRQASLRSVASPRRLPTPRRNANGVDLNRNWPRPAGVTDHWLPISGTANPRLPWYRGPSPISEPESRAMLAVLDERPPAAMIDLHSSGQILVYPWTSKTEPPADEAGYWQMIDALRSRQQRWRYRAKQSREWYPIIGSLDDYAYDRFGTLLLTVEIGRPAEAVRRDPRRAKGGFWWANPIDVAQHIDNDAAGCLDALLAGVRYRVEVPFAPAERAGRPSGTV